MEQKYPNSAGAPGRREKQNTALLLAAALFLFTQILFGFHHHFDDDQHDDESSAPAVECSLCTAIIHHPADVSQQPAFHLIEQGPLENSHASHQFGEIAAAAPAHPPRAPPSAHHSQ